MRPASHSAHDAPIENPSVPTGASGVAGMPCSANRLARTRCAMASTSASASSFSAASGVSAVRPTNRSGARAVNPASDSRSQTPLKNGVRPHQEWSTRTPGPSPESGTVT